MEDIHTAVVGSLNPVKVRAVEEMLRRYPAFQHMRVEPRHVASAVAAQPLALEEMWTGAEHRATAAREPGELGVGLESGIFLDRPGLAAFDVCVAVVVGPCGLRGRGISSAFEVPPMVLRQILHGHREMCDAFAWLGLAGSDVGRKEGASAVVTAGRLTRLDQCAQALVGALARLDMPHLYTEVPE